MRPDKGTQIISCSGAASQYECPVCASGDISVFWEASDLPVFCNVLCATREEALQVPRGDIRLGFCGGCGLIRNVAFEPERLSYGPAYENSLHFSPRFQEYADTLAARLVDRYALRGKVILEIASGKGDFLRKLCELGDNRGIGFDPSCQPDGSEADGTCQITFIQDSYSERHADLQADFICCRHALEHIADPLEFLRMIRRGLGDRTDAIVFFEVPNALFTLRELGIWDLIYEHCTYFVSRSLRRLFALAGFDVLGVTEEYGEQFLSIEATPSTGDGGDAPLPDGGDRQLVQDIRAFAARYRNKVNEWRARLGETQRGGQRAVVWGSGSKGVTFLNIMRPEEQIEFVVDINPRKAGMFVAGTGQEIVTPAFLRTYRPETVVVMNPIYVDEIRLTLKDMDVAASLLVA